MNDCAFLFNSKCCILKNTLCSNKCKFRKTESEFKKAQLEAKTKLTEKGLETVMLRINDIPIISTRRIKEDD